MTRPSDLVDHFVYRAWDADDQLLYIGCSKNVEKRLADHKFGRAAWHPLMARVTVDGPYSYTAARSIEYVAIRTEEPSHNAQAPAQMAARRARRKFFELVMNTAIEHGEDWPVAMEQASIACEHEFGDAA